MSSSRGTSPHQTNSSQASDIYQFLRTGSQPEQKLAGLYHDANNTVALAGKGGIL